MAGTGVAARFGILIKGPQVLELAHLLNVVAFNKTGTLTVGKPRLLQVISFSGTFSENDILATAAGLQLGSEHPLAKALLDATKQNDLTPITPTDSKALPGIGISGKPSTGALAGQSLTLQSIASLESNHHHAETQGKAQACFEAGQTVSILMSNEVPTSPIAVLSFGGRAQRECSRGIPHCAISIFAL
jgi:Cu+-exporting ATPase